MNPDDNESIETSYLRAIAVAAVTAGLVLGVCALIAYTVHWLIP